MQQAVRDGSLEHCVTQIESSTVTIGTFEGQTAIPYSLISLLSVSN